MYNLIVAPNFGKNRVQMIKKSDVKKFYNRLADGKRMQIATIDNDNIHNVLHQVFQIVVDDNIIRINPTDNMLRELKMSRDYRSEKRKALTIKQQEIFLSYMKKNPKYQHWFPVFFIMLNAKNGTTKRTMLSQRRFQETHIIARGGCVNTDTVGTQKYVSERTRVKLARFANPNLIACSFSFWFRYMQNSII